MKYENKALAAYTAGHFCIDCLCALFLWKFFYSSVEWAFAGFMLYHLLAFLLQPLFGLLSDKEAHINWTVASGLLAVLSVMFVGILPFAGLFTLGIANAFFHIEGGYVSLHREKRNLAPGGVFVSGGALGLSLGALAGQKLTSSPLLFGIMSFLALACLFIGLAFAPKAEERKRSGAFDIRAEHSVLLLLTVSFFAVLVRGYAGNLVRVTAEFGGIWKPVIISIFVFAGKFFGGFLADKFGVRRVAVISLLLSAVCLSFSSLTPVVLLGLFLLNVPMAITLGLLSDCLPDTTGFAFGLAPMALIIATLISKFVPLSGMAANITLAVLLVISAAFMLFTLKKK